MQIMPLNCRSKTPLPANINPTMKILAFGKITDILGGTEQDLSGPKTVAELRERLETDHPELKNIRYLMAVDKKTANDQTALSEHSEVALLPPFSGG